MFKEDTASSWKMLHWQRIEWIQEESLLLIRQQSLSFKKDGQQHFSANVFERLQWEALLYRNQDILLRIFRREISDQYLKMSSSLRRLLVFWSSWGAVRVLGGQITSYCCHSSGAGERPGV